MTTVEFVIKQGATLPNLEQGLIDGAGHPVALTGFAATVEIHLTPIGEYGPSLIAPADWFTDEVSGQDIVRYSWVVPVTLPLGLYRGEWKVLWLDEAIEYYPSEGFFTVKIATNLA